MIMGVVVIVTMIIALETQQWMTMVRVVGFLTGCEMQENPLTRLFKVERAQFKGLGTEGGLEEIPQKAVSGNGGL